MPPKKKNGKKPKLAAVPNENSGTPAKCTSAGDAPAKFSIQTECYTTGHLDEIGGTSYFWGRAVSRGDVEVALDTREGVFIGTMSVLQLLKNYHPKTRLGVKRGKLMLERFLLAAEDDETTDALNSAYDVFMKRVSGNGNADNSEENRRKALGEPVLLSIRSPMSVPDACLYLIVAYGIPSDETKSLLEELSHGRLFRQGYIDAYMEKLGYENTYLKRIPVNDAVREAKRTLRSKRSIDELLARVPTRGTGETEKYVFRGELDYWVYKIAKDRKKR